MFDEVGSPVCVPMSFNSLLTLPVAIRDGFRKIQMADELGLTGMLRTVEALEPSL